MLTQKEKDQGYVYVEPLRGWKLVLFSTKYAALFTLFMFGIRFLKYGADEAFEIPIYLAIFSGAFALLGFIAWKGGKMKKIYRIND